MKRSFILRGNLVRAAFALLATAGGGFGQAPVQPAPAPPANQPVSIAPLEAHVAANLRLLMVLESYAEALASARDVASAEAAAIKIEAIAREAGVIGAEVLKLGKPSADVQQAVAKNPEILLTGRRVTARTRAAAQAISSNAAVAGVLKPSMRQFQQVMQQLQQSADTGTVAAQPGIPGQTAPPVKPAPATASAGTPSARK